MTNLKGTETVQAAAPQDVGGLPSKTAKPMRTIAPRSRAFIPSQGSPPAEAAENGAPAADVANGGEAAYVYALGRIEPRFPSLAIEKEFAQATGRAETVGQTDRAALQTVLTKSEHRYLARRMCWVLAIQSLDTYILQPEDPSDMDILLGAIRPTANPGDLDVVIGVRGPVAPPTMCNGLMVPLVIVSQIYSFDRATLLKSIPKPEKMDAKEFRAAAEELFDRIIQLADNAGATDEHRALNYVAVRYPAVYAQAAESFSRSCSLTSVQVRGSPLSGTRRIVEVIFTYTNRQTDVAERFSCRVDVTEEFPFLFSKLAPFYDHW
jgi:cyclic patellamide precursor peptide PatG